MTIARRHYGPSIKALICLYKALIRSQADYGLIVYGCAPKTHIDKLDAAVRVSLRTILGAKKSTPILYSELGIEGNDKADSLAASECLTLTNKVTNTFLSVSEAITKFKKTWTEKRCQLLHQYGKPVVQLYTKPSIAEWLFYKSRSTSVALHRLRSVHNNLNTFKHRIDSDEDPSCRFGCEAIKNANHVILHCDKKNIPCDIDTVLGFNQAVDRATQLKLSGLLADYNHATKLDQII